MPQIRLVTRIFILTLFLITLSCQSDKSRFKTDRNGTPIVMAYPKKQSLEKTLDFVTIAEPIKSQTLAFLSSGRVSSCMQKPQKTVLKGEVLCSLHHQSVKHQLDSSKKQLQAAKQAANPNMIKRQKELYDKKMISKSQYEIANSKYLKAQSALAAARAQVQIYKEQSDNHQIRAPFNGLIVSNFAKDLQAVSPGTPAFVIVDTSSYELKLQINHFYHKFLNYSTQIRFSSSESKTLSHKIAHISKTVDPQAQSISMTILAKNTPWLPGQLVEGKIVLVKKPNALTLPASCFIRRYGNNMGEIFIVNEKKLTLKKVQTGIETDGIIEVVTDLAEDTMVANVDVAKLIDGQKVKVLKDTTK